MTPKMAHNLFRLFGEDWRKPSRGQRGMRVTEPIFNERGERVLAVVPNTLAVYRNLRIGLGLTALMLGASIIIQSTYVMHRDADKLCWQGALSEYFYTSAHNVFVAGLVGLATMLFIYRGTTDTGRCPPATGRYRCVDRCAGAAGVRLYQTMHSSAAHDHPERRRGAGGDQVQPVGSRRGSRRGVADHAVSPPLQHDNELGGEVGREGFCGWSWSLV